MATVEADASKVNVNGTGSIVKDTLGPSDQVIKGGRVAMIRASDSQMMPAEGWAGTR
jgi:hypothetical protein